MNRPTGFGGDLGPLVVRSLRTVEFEGFVSPREKEIIFIELLTSDQKLNASREGSPPFQGVA